MDLACSVSSANTTRRKLSPSFCYQRALARRQSIEGLDAGADDYIAKPFTARELSARVDAHISLAHMRREADQARRLSEARLGLALEGAGNSELGMGHRKEMNSRPAAVFKASSAPNCAASRTRFD